MELDKINLETIQDSIKTLDSVRESFEVFSDSNAIGVQRDILSAIRKLNEMYVQSKEPKNEKSPS